MKFNWYYKTDNDNLFQIKIYLSFILSKAFNRKDEKVTASAPVTLRCNVDKSHVYVVLSEPVYFNTKT